MNRDKFQCQTIKCATKEKIICPILYNFKVIKSNFDISISNGYDDTWYLIRVVNSRCCVSSSPMKIYLITKNLK